ncbi:MAG TPA: ATP-binding protein [Longimicrobium sp.]|nr:ATP-binding protein [Longimicrobium sp.]
MAPDPERSGEAGRAPAPATPHHVAGEQVRSAQRQIEDLRRRVAGMGAEHDPVLEEAVEALYTTLEELQVSEEELRVQAEELAASQQVIEAERLRYRELFQHAPDAYLVTSPDGLVTEANAAAARLLNLDAHRLIGKPLGVFVPPEVRRDFRVRLAQAAREGRLGDWETSMRPRRGAPVSVACTVAAVHGPGGTTTGLRWLVRDVSERRRAEEGREALLREGAARAETERRRAFLEAVVRHMPGGVMIAEAPDGRITMHNAEAERILGHPLRPDTALLDFGSYGMLGPDGAPAPPEAYPLARALLRGETLADEEVPYRRVDGRTILLRCSASPVRGPEGETAAAVVSFTDATDELRTQRAERFLSEVGEVLASSLESRDILQQVARLAAGTLADYCMVHVRDGEGVRTVGAAHADPRREEMVRGMLRRFPLHPSRDDHPVLRALRTGEAELVARVDEAGLDRLCTSPEHRDMVHALGLRSAMAVPIRTPAGVLGVLALARTSGEPYDALDLRVAQALARRAAMAVENARLYEEARKAVAVRDEVVAVVSHDLRNPLNAILLAATVLGEFGDPERLDARDRKQIEVIRRAADQMTALTQDLVEVSALESGTVTVNPRACAPATLLSGVDLFAAEAEEKGIALRTSLPDELPRVQADYGRVLQAMGNLLGNAVKFTPAGGEVEVGASRAAEYVRFWVRDTGPGIEREHLPRLFDRFWQARRGGYAGAGLGLAIVRGIVEAHGGQVWAESEPGAGSTFHFTLRIVPEA